MIQHWTDIQMKETKRNRRKQSVHLAGARAIQKINDPDEEWREGNGRKHETLENSKVAAQVEEWMLSHPDGHNKSECARDLCLDRKTVRKWWKQVEEQSENYLYKKVEREIIRDITEEFNRGAGYFSDEERVPNFD